MALLLLAVPVAWAATDPASLYAASVPLADGSSAAVRDARSEALRRVLVKLTGRSSAGTDAALLARLGDPEALMQQYRRDAGALWVRFDREALRRALAAAGYAVLGDERPTTLVWLSVGAGAERALVTAAADASPSIAAARTELLQAADERALPLRLPPATAGLAPADLAGETVERVRAASAAWPSDAILVGRAQDAGPALRWTLLVGADRYDWQGSLADGPAGVAERLAARLAPVTATVEGVALAVDGIRSADQYGAVLGYLQGLEAVDRVAVSRAAGERVVFTVQVRGGAERLQRVLAARRVLEPQAEATAAAPAALAYRLAGTP